MVLNDGDSILLELRARADAWRSHIDGLLTEALNLRELADLFSVTPKKMATILKHIPAAVRIDRCTWRVPLRAMPPAYHVAAGLIPHDSATRAA